MILRFEIDELFFSKCQNLGSVGNPTLRRTNLVPQHVLPDILTHSAVPTYSATQSRNCLKGPFLLLR